MRSLLVAMMLPLCAHAGVAEDVFQQVRSSVVSIDTLDDQGRHAGQGSGVAVGPERIVTNCHVVSDAHRIRVAWQGKTFPATLFRQNEARDLCLLSAPGVAARAVALRKRGDLQVGEAAYAVGNPLGFELTVSAGLISALPLQDGPGPIHTSAPLSPGSSGGGLFDGQGRLMGVTASVFTYAQNFNTALPADWVEELLASQTPLPPEPALPAAEPVWDEESERLTQSGNWTALQAHAQRYLDTHPSSANARTFLGVAYMSLGDKAQGMRLFQDALKADPNLALAWRNLAYALHSLSRFGEAEEAVRKAIMLYHGQDAIAWVILGDIEFALGRVDGARSDFERAVALFPGNAAYWGALGRACQKLERRDEAIKAFSKALRLNPNDVASREALARLQPGITQSRPVAAAAASPQEVAPARSDAAPQDVAALNPSSALFWARQAQAQAAAGRFADEEISWLRAAEIKSDEPEYWIGVANARARLGNHQGSATAFKRAVKLEPDNAQAWSGLASARAYLRRNEEAQEAAEQALKLDARNVQAMNVMAKLHGDRGEYLKAVAYLDKAIALQPNDINAWNGKGYSLQKMGRVDEAIKVLEQTLELNPEFVPTLINLGEAYLAKGKTAQAQRVLSKAVASAPRAMDAKMFLAEAYLRSLQPGAAREYLDQVVRALPTYPKVWRLLTEMYWALGEKEEAGRALERLASLDPAGAASLRGRLKITSGSRRR